MSESTIARQALLALSRIGARLFRNNVGLAWVGRVVRHDRRTGTVVLENARPLHAGLCQGSSDYIGWHTLTITPQLVGRRLAVFVAFEAKSATGRPSAEQKQFLAAVEAAGGVALLASDPDDAVQGLTNWQQASE